MDFNSIQFILFLLMVVVAYYAVQWLAQLAARYTRLRYSQTWSNALLLAASYFFYMKVAPQGAVYIIASTLLTYGAGLLSPKLKHGGVRKAVLTVTILLNLSFLLVFKYAGFAINIANSVSGWFGGSLAVQSLSLVIPLGISFYTFQSLGYVIDVFRKNIEPERNIVTYALFISFFLQLLSGPIGRAKQLLPQFHEKHKLSYTNLLFGAQRYLWGIFKKAVIADWLGILVNGIYDDLETRTGLVLIAAVLMYSLQVYVDFSAYMDMALGASKMLGFTLMENFNAPFFATNMSGFWKRWHISLTTWLTDYIFTPLVWSRWVNKLVFGKRWQDHAPHFAVNIMLVFLISGLWHGASVNFLVWGALHGLFRILEELFHKIKKPSKIKNGFLRFCSNSYKRVVVFLLAAFALVFFKVPTFDKAIYVIKNLFASWNFRNAIDVVYDIVNVNISSDIGFITFILATVLLSTLLAAFIEYFMIYKAPKNRSHPGNVLQHFPPALRWVSYVYMLTAIVCVGAFGASSFIYYAF